MQQKIGRKIQSAMVVLIALSLAGCDEDKELAELAKEANRQQARRWPRSTARWPPPRSA